MKTILDVSNIVYGGHFGSPNFRIKGFPLGGVRKLMGLINAGLGSSEFILCFDSHSVAKKELFPTYKAGRVPNYSVSAQLDLLREMLVDCDTPYLEKDGWEADDLICSCVHFFGKIGDRDPIDIYSDDRDLACCVAEDVRVRNVTSHGICIDKRNYEQRVAAHETVPYNTILLHKMMHGDTSDNYPGVSVPGLRFEDLALAMTSELQPMVDSGRLPEAAYFDINVVNIIIDELPESVTTESKEKLKKQAKLVFPQLCDITNEGELAFWDDVRRSTDPLYQVEGRHINIFGLGNVNRRKFDFYCNVLGLNKCRPNRIGENYAEQCDKFKEKLSLLAKELSSGVMAVERYRHGSHPLPGSSTKVENMELPI